VTRGQLPQRAGSLGLNGGGTATAAQCADVNIGGRKYALRCVIGNVGDGNFRPSFYKKQYLCMDRLVVVKFHMNIANRWHFMIQRKIIANIHYS